jgi:dihydroorotate dehydrogenase electron transfer subunit
MNDTSVASEPARLAAVDAHVTRRTALCREHVALEFTIPAFPPSLPGQFLQLRCKGDDPALAHAVEWPTGQAPHLDLTLWDGGRPYLRRPFSIADRFTDPDGRTILAVISRAVGVGTRWLDQLQPGAPLNISGPLGRGFRIPDAERPLVLIGGGVGIPPLLYLARILHEHRRRAVTLVLGATTRELFPVQLHGEPDRAGRPTPCVALPGNAPFETIVTTDDGTLGLRGYVTAALEQWRPAGALRPLVFACGPDGMLRAVAAHTRALGWDCQLCIETVMGCGLGTCLSCVVRVADATRPAGWRWALSCSEGPVFERDALLDGPPPHPA